LSAPSKKCQTRIQNIFTSSLSALLLQAVTTTPGQEFNSIQEGASNVEPDSPSYVPESSHVSHQTPPQNLDMLNLEITPNPIYTLTRSQEQTTTQLVLDHPGSKPIRFIPRSKRRKEKVERKGRVVISACSDIEF